MVLHSVHRRLIARIAGLSVGIVRMSWLCAWGHCFHRRYCENGNCLIWWRSEMESSQIFPLGPVCSFVDLPFFLPGTYTSELLIQEHLEPSFTQGLHFEPSIHWSAKPVSSLVKFSQVFVLVGMRQETNWRLETAESCVTADSPQQLWPRSCLTYLPRDAQDLRTRPLKLCGWTVYT